MDDLFLSVLNLSITGSYVILAVLLFRLILRKAPKKFAYALWAVAGFRLCCGLSFSSALSIFNLGLFDMDKALANPGTLTFIPADIGLAAKPEITMGFSYLNSALSGFLPEATPQYSVNPLQVWIHIGALLWFTGMVVIVLWGGFQSFRLKRRLASAIRLEGNIWQSEAAASPFIFGILCPKIYIPFNLEEGTLACVLGHERHHLKRGDHLIKCFAFLLLAVHWFNPLCWLAFRLMTRDMEMSCDEAVLSRGATDGKGYSTALLSAAGAGKMDAVNPVFFGESDIKRRIRNILSWRAPGLRSRVLAALVCVIVCIGCAANPVTAEPLIQLPEMNTDYIVDAVCYMSPSSSFYPGTGSTVRYRFTPEGVYEEIEKDYNTYSHTITAAGQENAEIDWIENWTAVPFTQEQWRNMFEFGFLNPPAADELTPECEYHAVDENHFLLRYPENLYFVTIYPGPDGKMYIWSIYHLALEP